MILSLAILAALGCAPAHDFKADLQAARDSLRRCQSVHAVSRPLRTMRPPSTRSPAPAASTALPKSGGTSRNSGQGPPG